MKIDLNELERVALDPAHPLGCGPLVTLALVARIRALQDQARRTVLATGMTVEDELIALEELLAKDVTIE